MQIARAPLVCLLNVARWKRARIRAFVGQLPHFSDGKAAIRFATRRNGAIGVWASREPADLAKLANEAGISIARIEDGFIRSIGLGAALTLPFSIILDWHGIYYDPRQESDLEALLQKGLFDEAQRQCARQIIAEIQQIGLTKYNLGGKAFARPQAPRVVLAIGQVVDDRAMLLSGAGIQDMEQFLAAVRAREPDAKILFKPHPDVDAGLRRGALADRRALAFADQIIRDVDLNALLHSVDCVHVISSLAGFEALIRGKPVIAHGQPFYAGWGLTQDVLAFARPRRPLCLEDLVAGVLMRYPLYLDPDRLLPCTAWQCIRALRDWRERPRGGAPWLGRLIKALRAIHP